MAVERHVRLDLAFGSDAPDPVRVTDEGYKVWRCTFTYGDVVLPYEDPSKPGGRRMEFRPADEVLSDKALESMVGKPIVKGADHPDELLTPETTRNESHGTVLKAWREGTKGRLEFISHSSELDEWIENGTYEVSAGYATNVVQEPGEFQGTPYDSKQTNHRNNHLLVCHRARAVQDGEPARITGDAIPMDEEERKDMLSDEGMKAIEALGEDDQALIKMALENYYSEEKGSDDMAEETADMPEMSGDMQNLVARVEALEAVRGDKAPDTDPATPTTSEVDVDAILAQAEAKAIERFDARASEAEAVRRIVGDSWTGNVESSKLDYIGRVLPGAKAVAVAHVKAKRFDRLDDLFVAAQGQVEHNAERLDSALGKQFAAFTKPNAGPKLELSVPKGASAR